MSGNPKIAVGLAALNVAMNAKLGWVDQMDVDDMVNRAKRLIGPGEFMHDQIVEFATGYEVHWNDPQELQKLGENLEYAVHLSMSESSRGGDGGWHA